MANVKLDWTEGANAGVAVNTYEIGEGATVFATLTRTGPLTSHTLTGVVDGTRNFYLKAIGPSGEATVAWDSHVAGPVVPPPDAPTPINPPVNV